MPKQPTAPPPHVNLRPGDRPFWDSIVSTRDGWTAPDLELAAVLARCKADIERLHRELAEQGYLLAMSNGTPVVNPRHTLIETMTRRAVAMSRMLRVHAEAIEGESRHQRPRNRAARAAQTAATAGHSLIPGLRPVK